LLFLWFSWISCIFIHISLVSTDIHCFPLIVLWLRLICFDSLWCRVWGFEYRSGDTQTPILQGLGVRVSLWQHSNPRLIGFAGIIWESMKINEESMCNAKQVNRSHRTINGKQWISVLTKEMWMKIQEIHENHRKSNGKSMEIIWGISGTQWKWK